MFPKSLLSPKSPLSPTSRGRRTAVLPMSAAVVSTFLLGACAGTSSDPLATLLGPNAEPGDVATGSIAATPASAGAPTTRLAASAGSGRIAQARALRARGDRRGALALLEKAGDDAGPDLQREQGMLALELGQVKKAERLLARTLEGGAGDWTVHSALGAALAAQGRQTDAQRQFAAALTLSPDEPAVLHNLALSYALDGKRGEAEQLLRRVAGAKAGEQERRQAKQNLALMMGLDGRHEEAGRLAQAALPAPEARANVAFLRTVAGEAQVSRADPPSAQVQAKAP